MKTIHGSYSTAKVFTDNIEESAEEQIKELCDQEFTYKSKIRIMPDVHAGAGCTIGTTMTITDKVVPNLVGVDIGCGMLVAALGNRKLDLSALDEVIKNNVPSGFNINDEPIVIATSTINDLRCIEALKNNNKYFERSIGSLGGGNHFIEVDVDESENKYLVIHSGSRNLGNQVARHYQDKAYEYHQNKKQIIQEIINTLKGQNRHSEIAVAIKEIKNSETSKIPKDLCYLEGELFNDYIHDMELVQHYASLNRKTILDSIVYNVHEMICFDEFEVIHNYIDTSNMILRKGAISAQEGERVLIPINMRDGCIFGTGKGNPDWNYSAPHGAGRTMSRREARENLTLDKFKSEMQGIYSSSIKQSTIDEAPMAYKSIDAILGNINDTVGNIELWKPIYNFKAV